jgi:hypothetical protein
MSIAVGEDGVGDECGCGPVLCLPHTYLPHSPRLLHTAVGKLHYCITSLQRKHATRPRIAAVSLVQHASCKLREGAVLSAYCSEVVRHGAESVLYPGEVNMIVYR